MLLLGEPHARRPLTKVVVAATAKWASAFLRSHPTANYVAVEFSPKMGDLASRRLARYRRRVHLIDQDLNASLPGGPFDLVVSFFAIHHVENKQRLIGEVIASLAPGGLFLYADPTAAGQETRNQTTTA